MTSVEFYKKLSDIMEHYKAGVYNEAKANKEIVSLNAAAKDSKLELEADPKLLEGIKNEIEDEDEYYDDSYDSYEDSYYDED